MSTRGSIYYAGGLHVWEECLQGAKYGLLMSGDQAADEECDSKDFERIKIPWAACEKIAEWVAYQKDLAKRSAK